MLRSITIILVGVSLLACSGSQQSQYKVKESLVGEVNAIPESVLKNDSLSTLFYSLMKEINFDSLGMIDSLVYATQDNFTKTILYPCSRCFVNSKIYWRLIKAQQEAQRSQLSLVVYDCYRPFSVQKRMYSLVNNSDYVAKPTKGSKHNKGLAVDLSLANAHGQLLDMGSEFDEFSSRSHYNSDSISKEQFSNRKKLRNIMENSGFTPYDKEWWHFTYNPRKAQPVFDYQWKCD